MLSSVGDCDKHTGNDTKIGYLVQRVVCVEVPVGIGVGMQLQKLIQCFLVCILTMFCFVSVCEPVLSKPAKQNTQRKVAKKKQPVRQAQKKKASSKKQVTRKKRSSTSKNANHQQRQAGVSRPQPAGETIVLTRGLEPSFDRVLQADLFVDNVWMLPHQTLGECIALIERFVPTYITGTARFSAGVLPTDETVSALKQLRFAMQRHHRDFGLDLTIDLAGYASAAGVRDHMQRIFAVLPAESWVFDNASSVYASRKDIYMAAVSEAQRQGAFAGGAVFSDTVPEQLDFVVIPTGAGDEKLAVKAKKISFKVKDAAIAKTVRQLPVLAISGFSQQGLGRDFAKGRTPSERRQLVMKAAKNQNAYSLAYPLFGPRMDNHTSYDATRDEFMTDTISRFLIQCNPAGAQTSSRAVP